MYKLWTLLFFVSASSCIEQPGPKFPPSKGAVWPKPKSENKTQEYYSFSPSNFEINVTSKTCTILQRAVERYSYMVKNENGGPWMTSEGSKGSLGYLTQLDVTLTQTCEEYPSYGMDESYSLTILLKSELKSASIWGILRGLETFSQLFYYFDDYKEIRINRNHIEDAPSYIHRGLLLDTSRHYISMKRILQTLDAMSYNKMNIFHWHIVDDQSFPYQSEKYPELSEKGAYRPWMIYTKADLQRVVEYARDRGIRVVPEIDVPGHTRSWGNAFPEILTKCNGGLGPMDPSDDLTYKMVLELYAEINTVFPDNYVHIGGDEVETSCWAQNDKIQALMREKNINVNQIQGLFTETLISKLNNSKVIVWQDSFEKGVKLPDDAIVQVWKWQEIDGMEKILKAGHKLVFSTPYYLDALDRDWKYLYKHDPRERMQYKASYLKLDNIVGGETCVWSEKVNDANVMSSVWSRVCGFAERFWSGGNIEPAPEMYNRVEEQTCRMIKRGIEAQPPNGPGLC